MYMGVFQSEKSEERSADDLVGNLPSLSIQEKYFMGQMLGGTGRDLLSKTPNQIVGLELPSLPVSILTLLISVWDLSFLSTYILLRNRAVFCKILSN